MFTSRIGEWTAEHKCNHGDHRWNHFLNKALAISGYHNCLLCLHNHRLSEDVTPIRTDSTRRKSDRRGRRL
ncbi:40S ribosomal protein S14-like protein [Tanacetum coccineum]